MKIIHRANTCFSIFFGDKHLLTDPWLDGPAVAQGWTPFPPAKSKIKDIPKPDLVYISHIHDDHCEAKTIDGIDKETPIICMNLGPNFLNKMLLKQGFRNINLLNEKEPIKLEGFPEMFVEVFSSSRGHLTSNILDSGVIFKIGKKVIVNFNDNHPTKDQCNYIKENYRSIDLAFIPCGGGSGYPAMYENLDLKEKQEIVSETMLKFDQMFSHAVDLLEPNIAVPVAGGFAIRGKHPIEVNRLQIRHIDENKTINFHKKNGSYKNSKLIAMQPGMELDLNNEKIIKGKYKVWTEKEQDKFFEKISKEKINTRIKSKGKIPGLFNLIKVARNNMWEGQNRNNMIFDYNLYIENSTSKEIFEIPTNKNEVNEVDKLNKQKPFLKLKLDQDTLLEWLLGYEDFNMLDSGHRISFLRKPNDYKVEAYFILSLFRL